MRKQISVLALAGVLVIPGLAQAGGTQGDLAAQIESLSRQLNELKAQMEKVNQKQEAQQEEITAVSGDLWRDMSNRFYWSGDFRSRYDYFSRDRYDFANPGAKVTDKNDSLVTNRLRLNMYSRVLENVEFVGRLAMFKSWGLQNAPADNAGFFSGFPAFDGNSGRRLSDNTLLVDRAIVNWNKIGGSNFWFSVGRRPTTDGNPAGLRMNSKTRLASPVSYMDWPFDGFTLGYAYDGLFGNEGPGRIRFCYGRGFEAGLGENTIEDTDFAGISWDIYDKDDRFVYFQSYVAMDVFNFPDFNDPAVASQIASQFSMGATTDISQVRDNIGDIYHTSALYMDKYKNINYFLSGGWSRTNPDSSKGMFNDVGAMMAGLSGPNSSSENGFSFYMGTRYDIPDSQFKVGAEYNYGSEYWIGMSPGHDDIYASKLATRGHVMEIYGIYDIPGRPLKRLNSAFIRVGYQHYQYNYTGSLDWNMRPYDLDSAADRAQLANLAQNGMFVPMVDTADQIYVTFEATF